MDVLQRMPWLAQDAVFKKLSEIAEVASLSKKEREEYDESLRHYRDTIAVMEGQYQEGERKGLEKGLEKGRAEGLAEGERKKALDMSCMLLAKGFSPSEIAEISGLSVEEIEKLQ